MKAGIYYTYGETVEGKTNEVILCSSGFSMEGELAFYVMNNSKATAKVYFSRASFNAKVKSGMIKPKYKQGIGSENHS